jgi:hypothetical protein
LLKNKNEAPPESFALEEDFKDVDKLLCLIFQIGSGRTIKFNINTKDDTKI